MVKGHDFIEEETKMIILNVSKDVVKTGVFIFRIEHVI